MANLTPLPTRRNGLRMPLNPSWTSEDEYVQSLLHLATSSDLFRNLCGGVHILDFLTREPDLYTTVLPEDWREWFDLVDVDRVLDLLMRDDLDDLAKTRKLDGEIIDNPPESLLEYIRTIRRHCLLRDFQPVSEDIPDLPRHVSVGMKTKKIHEVTNLSAYVSRLSDRVSESLQEPVSVIDFGSGQNYLGRTLASPPYNKHVIAIEKRHHNVEGAKGMDVHAKLATKEKIMRNKKEWKRQWEAKKGIPTPPPEKNDDPPGRENVEEAVDPSMAKANVVAIEFGEDRGSMTYVEHEITDGNIEKILHPASSSSTTLSSNSSTSPSSTLPTPPSPPPKSMIISLHSCGNLSHHALHALPLNPSIAAVAVVGCCYNLLTERLGPTTYKHPQLRPNHPRLLATGSTFDPSGFPLSKTLETFPLPNTMNREGAIEKGVRLNITARMMAVQAPYNWTPTDSTLFFTRHFYRTLLQRILLDVGVVKQCPDPGMPSQQSGGSITGKDEEGTPLIIGSLPKAAFNDFRTYVRAALKKLISNAESDPDIAGKTTGLTDDVLAEYEVRFACAKRNLSVIWSLMAFSAGVMESIIVTDRWLYLRELECVEDAWVDVAFGYEMSPRNFVVVGVKKPEHMNASPGRLAESVQGATEKVS